MSKAATSRSNFAGRTNYDKLPELASDLVRRNVNVIAAGGGTNSPIAAKEAMPTIPIVLCLATNPERTGLVASLARPGGNITGVGILSLDLIAKRSFLRGGFQN
jgi:putative ABC transport system substrate-binding protein